MKERLQELFKLEMTNAGLIKKEKKKEEDSDEEYDKDT